MKIFRSIRNWINKQRQNLRSLRRKIALRISLPKENTQHLRPTYKCTKKWYGNSYGGFYVNPDVLNQASIVYSFGIGKDISFDKKIMQNHACQVFGFDPTPKSIAYIGGLNPNPLFHFSAIGIAPLSGKEDFYLPKNEKSVSGSMKYSEVMNADNKITVNMMSLRDVMYKLGHDSLDILKIDIEGAEYEVLASILKTDIPIMQILVEFHDRMFEGAIRSKETVKLLRAAGYEIFAASMNYEEISFINLGLLKKYTTN